MGKFTWWKSGPIYQIYTRSFMDANGDGISDIKGIIGKLDYLKWLGVKGVWIAPVFESPMIDGGYDISNHCEIHPMFGDLKDFRRLVEKMHSLDMYLIIDIIANHTSDQHNWFKASVQGKEPFTDYYIWHGGKIDNNGQRSEPNNWLSCFGGSAWTWHPVRQQYYMHSFHPQQPNLNCFNSKVITEMFKIMKFWLDIGVDGFRFDAVKHIAYDDQFQDNTVENGVYTCHNEWSHPESFNIIKKFTDFLQTYSAVHNRSILSITESYTTQDDMKKYYVQCGVQMPFNFNLVSWDKWTKVSDLKRMIGDAMEVCQASNNAWPNWVLGNHDRSRIANRLRAEERPEVTDLANMLLLLLPGTPVCYYGDELGMLDVSVSYDQRKDGGQLDPDEYKQKSRDPCRAPVVWSDEAPNGGFSVGNADPWLPVLEDFERFCINRQILDPNSHVNFFRRILHLRRSNPVLHKLDSNLIFPRCSTLSDQQKEEVLIFVRHSAAEKENFTVHSSKSYLVILHLGRQQDPPNQMTYLNLIPLVKRMHANFLSRLRLKTPNVKHLADHEPIPLQNVPIQGLQGLVLELKSSLRGRSQTI